MGHRYHRRFGDRISYINQWVKYSLCLTNFIFLAVGTVFLVFGVIAFTESGGIPWKSKTVALHWLFNLTVICMVVGVITLFVSLAGFVGSLRENTCLLRFLNCCGPKSYLDWTASRFFSCDKSNISPEACGVPYSCCRQMNDISVNIINTSCGFGVQKFTTAEASRLVWTTGCVDALVSIVENNIVYFAYGFVSVAVFQLIAILLAKTLHTQINDQLRLLHQENNYY
ncbi:unnamed protein product [Schistosoma rodhaini]|uniref:Tetraspanin n=1 Tax=Schistosoma rodhaini TaxID=6188 RepID=A0AA85F7N5_9TREM|nr:unnamed protein product [Schistosoma rodhaini]